MAPSRRSTTRWRVRALVVAALMSFALPGLSAQAVGATTASPSAFSVTPNADATPSTPGTWTFDFTLPPGSGLAAGDLVAIGLPEGIAGSEQGGTALTKGFNGSCASPSSALLAGELEVTLPAGCSAAPGAALELTAAGMGADVPGRYGADGFTLQLPGLGVAHAGADVVVAPEVNQLELGGRLTSGGRTLSSENGRFRASMAADGSLQVTDGASVHWSKASGQAGASLFLDRSGDLELRAPGSDAVIWYAGTAGRNATVLTLEDDGTLQLHTTLAVAWTSVSGTLPVPKLSDIVKVAAKTKGSCRATGPFTLVRNEVWQVANDGHLCRWGFDGSHQSPDSHPGDRILEVPPALGAGQLFFVQAPTPGGQQLLRSINLMTAKLTALAVPLNTNTVQQIQVSGPALWLTAQDKIIRFDLETSTLSTLTPDCDYVNKFTNGTGLILVTSKAIVASCQVPVATGSGSEKHWALVAFSLSDASRIGILYTAPTWEHVGAPAEAFDGSLWFFGGWNGLGTGPVIAYRLDYRTRRVVEAGQQGTCSWSYLPAFRSSDGSTIWTTCDKLIEVDARSGAMTTTSSECGPPAVGSSMGWICRSWSAGRAVKFFVGETQVDRFSVLPAKLKAGATTSWSFSMRASAAGGLSGQVNDWVAIALVRGPKLPRHPAVTLGGDVQGSCSGATTTQIKGLLTVLLPVGCTLPPGGTLQVGVAGVTNPKAGNIDPFSFAAFTSADQGLTVSDDGVTIKP